MATVNLTNPVINPNQDMLNKNLPLGIRDINVAKETAAGQLPGILSSDNPLFKQQETMAKQEFNRRGLLPSAMAVQAGQGAILSVAQPLAAEAAGAERTQALQNQGIISQYGLNKQQIEAQSAAAEKGYQYQTGLNQQQIEAQKAAREQEFGYTTQLTQLQQQNQEKMASIQFDRQKELAALDQNNRTALAKLEMDHQQTLQNNASAVNMYGQTMQAISSILSQPELSSAQQQAGVAKQYEMLAQGLKLVGAIPPDAIDFTGTPQGQASPLAPAVNTTGGLAPGQQPLRLIAIGANAKDILAPGSFVGQTKLVEEQGPNIGPKGGQPSSKNTLIQWTPNGWVRV